VFFSEISVVSAFILLEMNGWIFGVRVILEVKRY